MKLKASISVTIDIDPNADHETNQEEVLIKLIDTCEMWLLGEEIPVIGLQYTVDDENKNFYLN